VDLIGAYSKRRDLADALVGAVQQLRQVQAQGSEPAPSLCSDRSHRQWRIGDRLSEPDQKQLIADFTAGTSKRKLAERYGISESSIKRLIRQHGASKESSGLAEQQWLTLPTAVRACRFGVGPDLGCYTEHRFQSG
jgi:hypothetical protein